MTEIFVESWAPEYGSPLDPDEQLRPAEGSVDPTVEVAGDWHPVDGRDDGEAAIAFVDGVQRVDARLTIDDPELGPIPGLCGTVAAGATVWERAVPVSTIVSVKVERWAVLGAGLFEGKIRAVVATLQGRARGITTEKVLIKPGQMKLFYVLDGKVALHYNGERYPLETGDSALLDGGAPHGWENLGNRPARALWVILG